MELLPVGVLLVEGVSPETATISAVNPACEAILGSTDLSGTPLGGLPFAYFYPDRSTRVPLEQLPCARAMQTGESINPQELHVRRPDGRWRVVLCRASPTRVDGSVVGAVVVEQDVTELRDRDAEARQKAHMLDALLEYIPEAIMITDAAEGRVLRQSEYVLRILGRSAAALQGAVFAEHVERYDVFRPDGRTRPHPDELPLARAARHGEVIIDEELVVRTSSGDMVPILCNAGPIRDEHGTIIGAVVAWRNIGDRKRTEAARRESEARARARAAELETVLDAVPAAVFISRDSNARFMEANRFAYEMLRVGMGSNVSESAPEGGHRGPYRFTRGGQEVASADLPVQRAASGHPELNCELDVSYDDGGIRQLFGNAVPLRDETGAIFGSVGAFLDVTELKRAEQALLEAARRKDEFLGVLSHELRNPLTPVHNALHILERVCPGSEQARRAQAVIARQAAHLRRLVDDLLDVTRITRGKVQLKCERADLAVLLGRTAEDYEPEFASRGIAFEQALPTEPVWVDGDPVRLAQVAGNLLQNAAKFTPAGGRVRLELEADASTARVKVIDTGVGISPQVLPRLFQPFMQADMSLDRSRGGLGLGLALVKGLIELHGGRVLAESAGEGRGATFTVELPCEARPKVPLGVPPPVQPG